MSKCVEYEWIRSGRASISIQIKEDGHIVVRSPMSTSQKEVEAFLTEKSKWIRTHQERLGKLREKQQVITEEMRRDGIRMASELIPGRVRYYADIMGVTYRRISIREQKTLWGSCSQEGNLNFNWKLVLMPEGVLDYVVVHELAHRIEMNHSKAFWRIVEQVLPDYRERKARLKEAGCLYR